MALSVSFLDCVEKASKQGYSEVPANLGYFESEGKEINADSVFILVVHYNFEKGIDDWPRPGNEHDVENLRKTFSRNRKCGFRECSPKKDDLLALLQDEQTLKRFFGAPEGIEPAIFFLIVLSHGNSDGVIFTDTLQSSDPKDYEKFTTKELFKSIKNIFPNCFKGVFLGPCRGQLEDRIFYPSQAKPGQVEDLTKTANSSRVSFEPNMRNLVIFYATVETTMSCRDKKAGTWFVSALCQELNEMGQNEGLLKLLTGVQNRIHKETIGSFHSTGQTPEFKLFSCDRKLIFKALDLNMIVGGLSRSGTDARGKKAKTGSSVEEKPPSINFEWWNPNSKTVLRGRRAVIFNQGEENEFIRKLDAALVANLGFETISVKIDKGGIDYYFSQSEKSWTDYGCFAAFIFAEISEGEDGQIYIYLNENEKVPIGELIHGLLGPTNSDWIGKPKLFFLVDTKSTSTDNAGAKTFNPDDFLQATNHCGWLVFTLLSSTLLQNFLEIFESQEIKKTRSLQESLAELLMERMNEKPEGMIVSTLPHLLIFQELERNFIQPHFLVEGKGFKSGEFEWDELLDFKPIKEEVQIMLLSSLPGTGKSTVMRELALELQRNLKGKIKVFLVVLSQTYRLFADAKKERKKVPSLALIVSHATGTREMEIQNFIDRREVILMFDGFDEISPYYRDQVLQVFSQATEAKVPIWIATRPHEEDAILAKFRRGNVICKAKIMPLDWLQQIRFMMMISKKSVSERECQIEFCRRNGSKDILGNPLHLKMIAELSDTDNKKGINLTEIYERIVDKKLRFALRHLKGLPFEDELISCGRELKIAAVKFLSGSKIDISKYASSGIVTISNGRAQFVHQTFAEFLAATHFIDCLFCENEKMPFNILKQEFHQVRKFVDLHICSCSEEKSVLLISLEKCLKIGLTKSKLENVILRENLVNFSTIAANLVTFNQTKTKGLNYVTTDQILALSCKVNEHFALGLLKNGAYEKLVDENTATVKMLVGAIENNFVQLFSKVIEKCIHFMELVRKNEAITGSVEIASSRNHHEVLRLVLAKGIIDPSDQDAIEWAMKFAVEKNSAECVELLIEHGARTAVFDGFKTAFFDIKTTEAFLKTKDEPVLKLASRIFDWCLTCENAEVANFLFEKFNVGENAEFEVRRSALIYIANWMKRFHNIAEFLGRSLVEKRGFPVCENDENDKCGWNAFHCAAKGQNLGLVKYYLEKDPALTKTLTVEGENIMHLLLSGSENWDSKFEICKFLHDHDAEMVKQKTLKNKTTLHSAAEGGLDELKWLVEEADVEVDDAVDDCGWNVMHFAASSPWAELKLFEYLHEKNPRLIEKRTKRNETPLHLVVRNKHGRGKKYNWFVSKGVDTSVRNSDGKTALQTANLLFL
ncbi:uncharacterized protein LOC132198710 [Neocloeon triangulifer]|uniref:uncharacterized protein LOC132198710 n=1 Tax=Neocloeon triangulifer TaxID=2078957 RepID=UPI00286F4570|nr:uncharacterized protein LOC132198710 [Neocloeon triangulifer]